MRWILLLTGLLLSGCAKANADDLIENFGSWHLFSSENAVTKQIDFFVAAVDQQKSSVLGLQCKPKLGTYFFFLDDKALPDLHFGSRAVIDFRMANGEPQKIVAISAGNGRLVVEERLTRPPFDFLLMTLYGAETGVGLSIGDRQWFFRLTGFSAAADALGKSCGFTPHSRKH